MLALTLALLLVPGSDDTYVFVHQNGVVALHRAGALDLVLFDRGREPSLCGDNVFYWNDAGIQRGDAATGKSTQWRAGNLRSPRCDGKRVIWTEMVGGKWSVMISPLEKPEPKLLFQAADSVFNPSFSGELVTVSDLYTLYFVALDGKLARKLTLSEIGGGGSSSDRFLVRGEQILFSGVADPLPAMEKKLHGEPSSAIYLYDSATKKRTRLTTPDTFAIEPTWVGDSIYFRGFRVGKKPLRDGIQRLRGQTVERVQPGYEPSN
jgi:hypothetical protein